MKETLEYVNLDDVTINLSDEERDIVAQLIDNIYTYGSSGTITLVNKGHLVEDLLLDGRTEILDKLVWTDNIKWVKLYD